MERRRAILLARPEQRGSDGPWSASPLITVVAVTSLLLVVVTALPLLRSKDNWIRVWDFPRSQIAVLLTIMLLVGLFVLPLAEPLAWVLLGMVCLSLAWQLWQIWPYTPLHPVEVETVECCPETTRIKMLISNVLMTNRDSSRLLRCLRVERPDVVLLVETDAWWDEQLDGLKADYPHAVRHPRDNTYGMHLFSKFELQEPQVRYLLSDDVPSIKAAARLPSGDVFVLYCMHPRPPPHADTEQRDAQLVTVGREVRRNREPAIVAGDLNDVAWSRTTRLFQEISGLLDPRVGRGFYPTFNANWRLLRWPLDHIFISPVFRLIGLSVLPSIGSDHFPLVVTLCYCPHGGGQSSPHPEPEDVAEANDVIRKGRQAAQNE